MLLDDNCSIFNLLASDGKKPVPAYDTDAILDTNTESNINTVPDDVVVLNVKTGFIIGVAMKTSQECNYQREQLRVKCTLERYTKMF